MRYFNHRLNTILEVYELPDPDEEELTYLKQVAQAREQAAKDPNYEYKWKDPDRIEERDFGELYHGTQLRLMPDIMKDGLDPQFSGAIENEYYNDDEFGRYGPPYHFTFLTDSPIQAMAYMPGGEYRNDNKDPNQAVLLKVSLPPELQEKLITDRGEFIRASFVIPPRYLKRIPLVA